MKKLHKILPYIALIAFGVAVFLVYRSVREYGIAGLLQALYQIPSQRLLLAAACCVGSYATLTLFDALAVRYAVGRWLPHPRVALASFVALSIGHSLGLAPLGSGTLRARYYARWGLDAEAIARKAMKIAADICVYTNNSVTVESL
jgi:uncharacterized membrane protein YbhN (UPF0104 family)